MTRLAYLFEAKGVQRYILSGGRLLDIAGGSELLASAIRPDGGDLLDACLAVAGFQPDFSRRAGGVFMLHIDGKDRDSFDRFRAVWTLAFSLRMPGLEFAEALAEADTDLAARDRCYRPLSDNGARLLHLSAARENTAAALLPVAGPFAERAPRSGMPALDVLDDEPVDESTRARRKAARSQQGPGRWPAADILLNDDQKKSYVWPVEMDADEASDRNYAFPFNGREPEWIGLVHADVSGLGETFNALTNATTDRGDAIEASRQLSDAIEQAIVEALRAAAAILLENAQPDRFGNSGDDKIIPARPVLVGGDDLTLIVRGDLALGFAERFLEAFEQLSAKRLKTLADTLKIPQIDRTLSACAGVVFAKSRQPFHQLLGLSESLCSHAKKVVKAGLADGETPASALAFHRITTSHIDADYADIIERELRAGKRLLTAQPYRVGSIKPRGAVATFADLQGLSQSLKSGQLGRGSLREIRTLVHNREADAQRIYARWRQIGHRRHTKSLDNFSKALETVLVSVDADLPFGGEKAGRLKDATPLFDAMDMEAVE